MDVATAEATGAEVAAETPAALLEEQKPPARPEGEQTDASAQEVAETGRHLSAVPTPEETPAAQPLRNGPPRNGPPRRATVQDLPRAQAGKSVPKAGTGEVKEQQKPEPSRDQRRRFAERIKAASTPAEVEEALRYGRERGIIPRSALEAALGEPGVPAAAAPAAQAAPAAPAATAAPEGTAQPGAQALPPVPPTPPPPPPEPRVMGQPLRAVKTAADQMLFAANMLEGIGRMAGWEAPPSESMTLFEGTEFAFECKGNPKKRLVELGSVELAAFTSKAGGESDSPFRRRVELGLLALGLIGPGIVPLVSGVMRGYTDKVKGVSRALTSQVRRWRR